LDRLAAVIIVIPVAKTGWDLFFEGMRVLLDASLEPKTLETIRDAVASEPMVVEVESITGRNAGRFRFVEITAALRGNDLDKADCAAHRIERRIREDVPNIERVLIHIDPKPPDRLRWAVPLADREGTVADHFGAAPFFALATIRSGNGEVEPPQILPNPHREAGRAKGMRVAEWLVEQKTDVIVLGDVVEKGPRYVFGAAAVTIRTINAESLEEVLAEATSADDSDRLLSD
jgi:predicted Fe-Mo cluster-binding NifX family protein